MSFITIGRRFPARKLKLRNLFRNEKGAVDLASIMVGVIVLGIVGGIIAASVFVVIPWSQDQAASNNLGAVSTAESVAYAQSTANTAGAFESSADLKSGGLLNPSPTVAVETTASGQDYIALSVSTTGKVYAIDSTNTKATYVGNINSDGISTIETNLSAPTTDTNGFGDANASAVTFSYTSGTLTFLT